MYVCVLGRGWGSHGVGYVTNECRFLWSPEEDISLTPGQELRVVVCHLIRVLRTWASCKSSMCT